MDRVLKRVCRHGFPRDTRCGSTVRLVDSKALAAVRFVPYALQYPSVPHRLYIVERRSARFLWLREMS